MTSMGLEREVERLRMEIQELQKENDRLNALVSPALEGGGVPLIEQNQILREALLDEDRVHIKIEKKLNKAIQAAILGLHTLAGEFPTPTWKTREDYLQTTISEINKILGK